jgi:hypothetical protein
MELLVSIFFNTVFEYIFEINKYVRDNLDSLYKDSFTVGNWNNLRTIYNFLDFFYQITFKTQEYAARLDRIIEIMDVLLIYLEKARVRYILFLFNLKIELIR